MSFSATRLTCFAIISALESDMRSKIDLVATDLPLEETLGQDLIDSCSSRRARDGLHESGALSSLLPYLDFADSYKILSRFNDRHSSEFLSSLQPLKPRFDRLVAIRNRVAHTRPMEIDDSATLLDVAKAVSELDPTSWSDVCDVIRRLDSDPSFVLGLTISLPHDPNTGPQHNLPIPDFDETGFFGRKDQLRRIKRAILGAYPVISILGDGGIGKTSIALKAAYELLEDEASKFEAIVWVTAKATVLTTTEIHRISGAIESSIGLFTQALSELSSETPEDPVDELLTYLENFRILLILDNMETVLDERLREFLLSLPLGSKVLITSRIGLGIENPIRLEPLNSDDATNLLRALARIRGVEVINRLPQESVLRLSTQMGGHPTFIKWFVSGIQAGKRPEDLVTDNSLLLDFCMSNVYDHLGLTARRLLESLQVLPGLRNQAELAHLNDIGAKEVQETLLECLTTNFVQMSSQPNSSTVNTAYQLSEFAKQYLDRHHPTSTERRKELLQKHDQLTTLGVAFTAAAKTNPYNMETVHVQNNGDVHVAKVLRDALAKRNADPAAALTLCTEAQLLDPTYYEPWRVEAHIKACQRDHNGALTSFERAIEIAPESGILCFHFGTFLIDEFGDYPRGLSLLQKAARADDASIEVYSQIAWAHLCLENYLDTLATSRHILSSSRISDGDRSTILTIALRAVAHGISQNLTLHQLDDAAELLEQCTSFVQGTIADLIVGEAFDRIVQICAISKGLEDSESAYIVKKSKDFSKSLSNHIGDHPMGWGNRAIGTIKAVKEDKGFGFIRFNSSDYFFHLRDLEDPTHWNSIRVDLPCAFSPDPAATKGPRADHVQILF